MLLRRRGEVVCIYILQDSLIGTDTRKKSSKTWRYNTQYGRQIRQQSQSATTGLHSTEEKTLMSIAYFYLPTDRVVVEMRMCTVSTEQVQGLCEFSARCKQPESKSTMSYCKLVRLAM